MGLITQTNEKVGETLSGITNGLTQGQTVFAIGWDKVFKLHQFIVPYTSINI